MADLRSRETSVWRLPQRVAYVVNHSFPYSSDGYAVRTHEVAKALTGLGHEVLVINRPGRPWDIEGFGRATRVAPEQRIDGVRYLFLPSPATPQMNRRARIRAAETRLLEAFEVFRPAAVVAASNWENAEPAQYAARRAGVPFFYEQRGFWEMSRAASDPVYAASDAYQQDRERELRIASDAQAVFTLNGAMRAELIRRGVPGEKIHLVPNGVSPPGPVAKGVTRAGLGCAARHLIGYIGSLSAYEGCEDLLELLARLRADGVDVDLLVVGSSAPKGLVGAAGADPQETRLRAQAAALGLQGHAHFVPQLPQRETGAYYGMLDAVIMPRRRVPVTELVSPLKPYAAAAYGVPVFMTDMPPLDEVAADIHGTLFPEGDIDALAGMVRRCLQDGTHPALQETLPPGVFWPQRILPMSRLLNAVRAAAPSWQREGGQAERGADLPGAGFDFSALPQVALRDQLPRPADETIAALGPCRHLPDTARVVRLSRANMLGQLATLVPGRFIIDWAGLQPGQAGDRSGERADEWDGLWGLENMRLNRQIMDACRIALQRGWQVQVLGPVLRSRAPLFRTVAAVVEEITQAGDAPAQEAAQ